jgi:hypothetical protein
MPNLARDEVHEPALIFDGQSEQIVRETKVHG